mmetsp:Transcript_67273/g.194554  ORF Transcript_67273/g.194554 Transcript_67273/m.194554 type:complete len:203 (+) Transcript_67273:418-1026(+)
MAYCQPSSSLWPGASTTFHTPSLLSPTLQPGGGKSTASGESIWAISSRSTSCPPAVTKECLLYWLSTHRHFFSASCGRNGASQVWWNNVYLRCSSQASATKTFLPSPATSLLVDALLVSSKALDGRRLAVGWSIAASPMQVQPSRALRKAITTSQDFRCVDNEFDWIIDFANVLFEKTSAKVLETSGALAPVEKHRRSWTWK